MALRNQPYIPLYVQDYLTDEKLNECSASAQGIYIKIMCIMHKSDEYGTILLKQKDKQNESTIYNFAVKLARLLPFTTEEINEAVKELISESVLTVNGDKMIQKRMVRDNEISIKRASAGKKGGETTQFAKAKSKPNTQSNSEYENVNEDVNESKDKGVSKGKCLMKNSDVKIEDIKEAFEKTDDLKNANYKHYYQAAMDWSDGKGEMRKDWIATVRGFARRDLGDGKLKIKSTVTANHVNSAPQVRQDYGVISPNATPMPEHLKERLKNIGK